jgi:hypothetical protein
MKQPVTAVVLALVLAFGMGGTAQAKQDTMDVARLSASLDQLAGDQTLGGYAQAEQARARDAINRLAHAGRKDRPHDLYLAERLVDLAKVAAQLQDARMKLAQEEAARLQAQGQAYSAAAEQARAEADKAKKLAAAQSRVATAARRQAALAAKAAKAMRSQMQEQAGAPAASSSTPAKTPDGGHDPGDWK